MNRNIAFILLIYLVFLSGCQGLRSKFVRKRQAKEAPVYVDFKDYPESLSREAYLNYYLFVRGWLDELMVDLESGHSFKRRRRAINEAIMNIEQIMAFFSIEGKEKLYPVYSEFTDIRDQIICRPAMSRVAANNIMRRVEQAKRRFEREFSYTEAEKWMN